MKDSIFSGMSVTLLRFCVLSLFKKLPLQFFVLLDRRKQWHLFLPDVKSADFDGSTINPEGILVQRDVQVRSTRRRRHYPDSQDQLKHPSVSACVLSLQRMADSVISVRTMTRWKKMPKDYVLFTLEDPLSLRPIKRPYKVSHRLDRLNKLVCLLWNVILKRLLSTPVGPSWALTVIRSFPPWKMSWFELYNICFLTPNIIRAFCRITICSYFFKKAFLSWILCDFTILVGQKTLFDLHWAWLTKRYQKKA